jgi:DNA-binding MarR family transcriptional regulator
MPTDQEVEEVAAAVYLSVGLFKRRLQQVPAPGELSLSEASALRKLERGGPATVTALARAEQISAQSMGATLSALEARGLVKRESDPADGRRAVMSVTETGLSALSDRRSARIALLARALAAGFTPGEMAKLMAAAPLIERLAESI